MNKINEYIKNNKHIRNVYMAIYLDVQKEKKAGRSPFRILMNLLWFVAFTIFAIHSYSVANYFSIKVIIYVLLAILFGTIGMNNLLLYAKKKKNLL
jgi:hypothetical protein